MTTAGVPRAVVSGSARPNLFPGMLLVGVLTLAALLLEPFTVRFGLGAATLAVALGVLVGNTWQVGLATRPGVVFMGRRGLTIAVVLLGFTIRAQEVAEVGWFVLGAAVSVVAAALAVAYLLGRMLGVPAPLAALLGAGTGICGVAAIAAARPAAGARDEDMAYAVASITFLGSIGLLVYPLVQLAWHPLDAELYGILAGATLQSVPQAVGAAFAGGGLDAGALATVTKLTRVALLGPVVLVLALSFRHRDAREGALRVPVEVWGFLLLFVLGSILPVPAGLRAAVVEVDNLLLVAALAALGLTTRFSDLQRAGWAPFLVALVTWGVLIVGVSTGLRWAL